MWPIEYYTTEDGHEPVREWLDSDEVGNRIKSNIEAKLEKLSENGLEVMLKTKMLERISGDDADLYELVGGQCRIVTHYDRRRGTFVLLHGFLKKGRTEPRHIEQARRRLRSYL